MIEAFARIFAKERPIDGEGSFKAYLYKTARNLSLRHMQKLPLPLLWTDETDFEPADDTLAESGLLKKEQVQAFHEGFEKLKADYREALYLIYFEDMSYKNAARVMKKSEKQFANLVARGKKSLKTILEREGFVYADE